MLIKRVIKVFLFALLLGIAALGVAAKPILRDVVVVIDPGHGGKDPGAIGARRTKEKDITLSISTKLQAIIDRIPGMKAVLTRSWDEYVPLRSRLKRARNAHADMFISIHADAYTNRRAHGASAFVLSESGASSEAAKWLARQDNVVMHNGVDIDGKPKKVKKRLLNKTQKNTNRKSEALAKSMLDRLSKLAMLHRDKVGRAAFVVLKSPDIPSVLIETGFISNHSEERRLRSRSYQIQLANALVRGVKQYAKAHPTKNSLYAALQRGVRTIKVKSGDTLYSLAKKYRVNVSSLKRMNGLKASSIYPGQRIRIPA